HISYPVLCYYRSQHDRQSWLAAMTAILDASALVMVGIEGVPDWQARLTFAMARHAVVDLAAIFNCAPDAAIPDRLPSTSFDLLQSTLGELGVGLQSSVEAQQRLTDLRGLYEPYVHGLADRMAFTIPPFIQADAVRDAWQTTAWHDGTHA